MFMIDPRTGQPIAPQAPAAPQAGTQNPYGLDPAVLEAMLGTNGDTQEISALERQMAAAEALRQPTPEGRQAGRVFVAANPLEHLGKGIGDYRLMKQRQANEAAQAAARKRIDENVRAYGKNLPGV